MRYTVLGGVDDSLSYTDATTAPWTRFAECRCEWAHRRDVCAL